MLLILVLVGIPYGVSAQYGEDFDVYEFSDEQNSQPEASKTKKVDSISVPTRDAGKSAKSLSLNSMDSTSIANMAVKDARSQFDGGGFRGLAIPLGILISPLIIPAVTTPVVDRNLLADKHCLENDIYYNAYKNEAKKIKCRKVMRNFGYGAAGSAAYLSFMLLLLSGI